MAVVVAAVVGVLAGCGGPADVVRRPGDAALASAPYVPTEAPTVNPRIRDQEAIQAVLDLAATGFRDGDADAVRGVLHDPDSAFGRRWTERVDHLREVPLSRYELRVDPSLPDLATGRVRAAYGDPVQVVYVVEEHALEGFDETGPAAEDLFLTMVETVDGWRIAGDRDGEPLGLVSVDHLWDHGPVVTTRDGPVLALHHPDAPTVPALLAEARQALAEASARWPLAWPGRVPIIVPRDEEELAELLHVTFELSDFIAFATATPVGELDEYRLTGSRIVLNPERFLDRSSEVRRRILVHELVHVASRPTAGPLVPSWLEEGVAQAIGEQRSTTGTRLLDALADEGVALPSDAQFTNGGRDRIFLSYQLAWSFVDHLRDRHGTDAVARFYAAVGAGGIDGPGTTAYVVDRAATEVFGASLAELIAGWRAAR
ncbi:MAG: basic secretory family protein [Actinobacteria bacterium]|nr:basic secretory family protein [Actinomycetota bacterium]